MADKHISSQFDADLYRIVSKVLEMGGIVESQLVLAMEALNRFDLELVDKVIEEERRLNAMEVEIDAECGNVIARRQPTASDLRLVMASSKAITNLERAGDEARKIAKRTDGLRMTRQARLSTQRKSGYLVKWRPPFSTEHLMHSLVSM